VTFLASIGVSDQIGSASSLGLKRMIIILIFVRAAAANQSQRTEKKEIEQWA
jgi:hypothetical protein